MSLNVLTASGRCTRDAELKHVGDKGIPLMVVNVAVDYPVRENGEWKNKAMFFKCELWGDRAEKIYEWFTKGAPVLFTGALRQETWTDKEGNDQVSLAVKLADIDALETKAQREQREGRSSQPADDLATPYQGGSGATNVDENIPF